MNYPSFRMGLSWATATDVKQFVTYFGTEGVSIKVKIAKNVCQLQISFLATID